MPIFTDLINSITANVLPVISDIVAKVGEWMDAFRDLPGPVQEAAAAIALALGVGGPVLTAIAGVSMAFRLLVASSGPIGLFIAAAAGIMAVWAVWGDDIKAALGPALEWIGEKFDAVVGAIQGLIDKAAAAKRALVDMFTYADQQERFSDEAEFQENFDFSGQGNSAGSALGDGFVNGLMGSDIVERSSDLFHGVTDAARDAWQIRSPSRIFREIGHWIMQGLGLGIADGAPGVAGQMGAVAGETADVFGGLSETLNHLKGTAQQAFSGLVKGTTSWRDALSGVLSKLADIAINGLFDGIWSGIFGGGGGGAAVAAGIGGLMGFARGGEFEVGGSGGVDSQLVAFRASPNETVTIRRPDQMGGDTGDLHVTVGIRDDGGLEAFVQDTAGRVIAQAAPGIQQGAVSQVDQAMRATKKFGRR
jgi:hypothetical protein